MRQGGFAVFDALVDGQAHNRWLSEALRRSKRARVSDVATSDGAANGEPPLQRRRCAWGGQVQGAIYHAGWMLQFLRELTGVAPVPNSRFGGYIYYTRPGDHVGIHRDDETCEVAAITCLYDGPHAVADGGVLRVYPTRLAEPLAAIRATPEEGAVTLRLRPGQTLVMFGRILPHAVLPVTAGQRRIVSALCYQVPSRATRPAGRRQPAASETCSRG